MRSASALRVWRPALWPCPENGEDLGLYPVDTEEEAREDLAYITASFSTFHWLDED